MEPAIMGRAKTLNTRANALFEYVRDNGGRTHYINLDAFVAKHGGVAVDNKHLVRMGLLEKNRLPQISRRIETKLAPGWEQVSFTVVIATPKQEEAAIKRRIRRARSEQRAEFIAKLAPLARQLRDLLVELSNEKL